MNSAGEETVSGLALEKPVVSPLGAIAAVTVGNALEFYDFLTYSFFAIQIGHAFFPSESAYGSLMLSLATFAAGFVTRPLGGIVIGSISDRAGRKAGMMLSFTLMGGAVAAMALIPPYARIGITAPVLVVLTRMVMGFALGGEVGPTTAYLLESAPVENRGLMAAWQGASQMIAAIAGGLVGFVLSRTLRPEALDSYGWRIAFLLGAVTVPFGLWIRSRLPETLEVLEEAAAFVSKAPTRLGAALDCRRIMVLGLLVMASNTISTYGRIYMTTFAQATLHMAMGPAFAVAAFGNLVAFAGYLLGGALSDRIGRRPVMIWPGLAVILIIYPVFIWMVGSRSTLALLAGTGLLSLPLGMMAGAFYAAFAESLPKSIRGGAFGTLYAVSIAAFGGTCQLVMTWLIHITGNPMAVAWYLLAAAGVGLVAVLMFPESAPVSRRLNPHSPSVR